MTPEQPPRLKHDAELGPLLRAAEPSAITPERLAHNAGRVKLAIAGQAATLALWKIGAVIALLLAVLVPLAVWTVRDAPASPVHGTPLVTFASSRELEAIDPEGELVQPDVSYRPMGPSTPLVPARSTAAETARRRPSREAGPRAAPPPPPPAPEIPAEPASDLPEQIRLYEEARLAGKRGALALGLARIDALLARFPATPLRAEAELTRAELLARANRYREAVPALEALIAAPTHRGRRGELLRTLGDLHRRHHDCPRAVAAYERALALGPRAATRTELEQLRERCARP